MTLYTLFTLAIAMLLLSITPGPGVIAVISKSLSSGFRSSLAMVWGIVVGDLVFLLMAIFGLSAIASSFHELFVVISFLGAAYLIWLGIQQWRRPSASLQDEQHHSKGKAFWAGLAITLSNPKVILFYVALLPTFVTLESLAFIDIVLIGCVVSGVLGGVMVFYSLAASRARHLVTSARSQSRLQKMAGSVMICAGITLAIENQ